MKFAYVLALGVIAVANGGPTGSSSWNSLLRAENIFSTEMDMPISKSSDILTQLSSMLANPTILSQVYTNYLTAFEKDPWRKDDPWRNNAQVFADNLLSIAKHNVKYEQGMSTWYKGVNAFTDMTLDQAREATGYIHVSQFPNITEQFPTNTAPLEQFPTNMAPLEQYKDSPDALDWRTKRVVTPVKNQEQCGSCWAFSVNAMLESAVAKKTGKQVNLSEQELVDCDKNNGACRGGAYYYALNYLKNTGVTSGTTYKYDSQDGTANKGCRRRGKSVAKASAWGQIARDEDSLKEGVANKGPLGVSILIGSQDFYQYTGGIYEGECGDGGHAVNIVGYGSEDKDFWIVKNSWGTGWGEKGFVRMVRGEDKCSIASREGGYWITAA